MGTRLFVSAALGNDARLELGGEQARYLGRVLRARVGDALSVFNGDDGEWHAVVERIGKSSVTLSLGGRIETHTESPLRLHLVQGVSRGERMDIVVQKATELGVKRITPVLTDHGVVRLDDARRAKRRDHWQRVAESAAEQCGRIRPPLVDLPLPLNAWFGAARPAGSSQLVLVPHAATPLGAVASPQAKLCLLVGPEGGLSERETADAALAGFDAVSLGPRVLRTETAAIAALVLAQASWGDIGGVPVRGRGEA